MGDPGSQYAKVKPVPGKTVQSSLTTQGTMMYKGDHILVGDPTGYFVVIGNHFLGQADLTPGRSNDQVHWSLGPAPSSPV